MRRGPLPAEDAQAIPAYTPLGASRHPFEDRYHDCDATSTRSHHSCAEMTTQLPMQIALASDTNYFHGLAVALSSVLMHTTGLERAAFHVLDGGLKTAQRRHLERMVRHRGESLTVTFHPLELERFRGVHLLQGSAVTYARLLLPELLEGVNEVLYLDADVYYGADLRILWECDLAGAAVAAARDSVVQVLGRDGPWLTPGSPDAERPYFNAGVIKIDLDYWRRHDVGGIALAIAQAEPEKCRYWDQTILNHLLKDSVTWVPGYLNLQICDGNSVDWGQEQCENRNLHYIHQPKPWTRHSRRKSFRYWRAGYAAGVSRWPRYMLDYRYWAMYVWSDHLLGTRAFVPICRILLASELYRLIPGITAAKLRNHVNRKGA